MTALFVFALPFALYGIGYGFFYLGRSLARLVPVLWAKLRQKEKGRSAALKIRFELKAYCAGVGWLELLERLEKFPSAGNFSRGS